MNIDWRVKEDGVGVCGQMLRAVQITPDNLLVVLLLFFYKGRGLRAFIRQVLLGGVPRNDVCGDQQGYQGMAKELQAAFLLPVAGSHQIV